MILADDPLESELGLARLDAAQGEYTEARRRLAAQLTDDLTPERRVDVLSAQLEMAVILGQIRQALELNEEIIELSKSFVPPISRLVSIESRTPTLLALLGRYDEAIARADEITRQLQPPFSSFMNFTYTEIYAETGDRDAFREQYPDLFGGFIAMETAQIALWDGEPDAAIREIERARDILDTSMLKLLGGNLSTSSVYVTLAELYLQAGAVEEAREVLENLLKIFPSYGLAKLTLARVEMARGNPEAARQLLTAALATWSAADAGYIHRQEAETLLMGLK
ncbi:MAG: tetratricopeptide repeat protein [Gammaproteobacteria bacterium]